MYSGRRRSGVRDDAVRDGRVRDDVELLEFRRRAEIAPKAGVMCHLTTVDGARTTGTLAYDPDGNVVVKIATETLELGAVLDAYDSISEVDRDAARRGGVRPRVLPRPKPPPRRRGLRAHVARGGPGDAAAARRRRAGGASAGAPDSSRGLVITLVLYPDVASMAYKTITTSPAPARTARAPWRVWAP